MIEDARRTLGKYVCSRYSCSKVSEVMTEMGGMCAEHAVSLEFPLQRPYSEAKEEHARLPLYVPWEFMRPHERQARHNHQQTLARLAERGGLDVSEALAVVKGRNWEKVEWGAAIDEFLSLLSAWKPRVRRLSDKFEPIGEAKPNICANCGQPRHDHYSGPFSKPGEYHCSKYGVPRAADSGNASELADAVARSLATPEGQATVSKALGELEKTREALREGERIDPVLWHTQIRTSAERDAERPSDAELIETVRHGLLPGHHEPGYSARRALSELARRLGVK